MDDIEVRMMGGAPTANAPAAEDEGNMAIATMISRKCVLFEDEEHFGNTSLLQSPEKRGQSAAATMRSQMANPGPAIGPIQYGNLIDLSRLIHPRTFFPTITTITPLPLRFRFATN